MDATTDTIVQLALALPRAAFVHKHDHFFLVGTEGLQKPDAPRRTVQLDRMDLDQLGMNEPTSPSMRPPRPDWLVLPLKKTQDTFPAMITVGRTANNDIVLADVTISKLHAFFQTPQATGLELCDAGSRNGTFVDGRRLPPRGKGEKVKLNDFLRFGQIQLRILDAGSTWDTVQKGLRGLK